MKQLFSNNAKTTLAVEVTADAAVLILAEENVFAATSIAAGTFELLTLDDGTNIEIVKVLNQEGDVLNVVRAQDGTAARVWPVGTLVEARITAQALGWFVSREEDPVLIGSGAAGEDGAVVVGIGSSAAAQSLALGHGSAAEMPQSVALGDAARAVDEARTTAIGAAAAATKTGAISLGYSASAGEVGAVAIGDTASTLGEKGISIGYQASAPVVNGISIGASVAAAGSNGVAVGAYAQAAQSDTVAVGVYCQASGINATAVGANASAVEMYGTAIGSNVTAAGVDAVALGAKMGVTAARAIGIGSEMSLTKEGQLRITAIPTIPVDPGYALDHPESALAASACILSTQIINLKAEGATTLTLPSGLVFYADEIGMLLLSASGISVLPSVQMGITGTPALLKTDGAITVNASLDREIWVPLERKRPLTTLRVEVTDGAVGTAMTGRFFFRGMVLET